MCLTKKIMIKVHNLAKSYDGIHFAPSVLSFEAHVGQRLIFIDGPNGCGKTTLLKILSGEEDPSQGYFVIEDPGQITIMYQRDGLLPEISALMNLRLVGARTSELILISEHLGLSILLLQKKAKNLSGGEERRVQLARTLISKRRLWLLDEPTSSADQALRELVIAAIVENITNDGTVILVTHDSVMREELTRRLLGICNSLVVELSGN